MIAPTLTCSQCGQPDARELGTEMLCAACAHERGSCGAIADAENDDIGSATAAPSLPASAREPQPPADGRLRLNPNCCYQACASCTSLARLREFRARFPHDWEARLGGSERLQQLARECG
jgi:hypothetical protein